MTDQVRLRKRSLKNTLYHLIARASKVLEQMQGDCEATGHVLNRMNMGWRDYIQAHQAYYAAPDEPWETCDICFDRIQTIMRLIPCGHTFHQSCAELWLKGRETCPYCREAVEKTTREQQD